MVYQVASALAVNGDRLTAMIRQLAQRRSTATGVWSRRLPCSLLGASLDGGSWDDRDH